MLKIDIQHAMLTSEGKKNLEICTEVDPKELLCLFGHSGAGKTTLLRILAGLIRADKGCIVFDNDIWFDSVRKINLSPQRRNIGFMFQDYALFPNMSVEGNIRFGQKGEKTETIENLLALFDLMSLRKQKPGQLSGGQKQRVALARVLASKPSVLLLDEPLSALDYEMRHLLQQEIQKVHERLKTTTLMVSHDIREVVHLATSVIILKNGAVISKGNPRAIFNETIQLLNESPFQESFISVKSPVF